MWIKGAQTESLDKKSPALQLAITRVDLLYRQNIAGLIAVAVNTAGFTWLAWPHHSHAFLLIWASLLILSVVARVSATVKWNKIKTSIKSFAIVQRWHLLIQMLLLVSGIGWGAMGWVAVVDSPVSIAEILFAGFVITGMSAGALATYAPSMPAMLAVLLPSTIPWTYRFFTSSNRDLWIIGVICLMFVALMIRIGRNLANYVENSLRLNLRLRESEENLRMARDSSDAISWQWITGGDSFSCEGNVRKLLGSKAPRTLGHLDDFIDCIHFDDREVLRNLFEAALKGKALDTEVRLSWPDESPHWIAIRGKAQVGHGEQVDRLSGICWDITAKKNQENLRHERDVFAASNRAKLVFLANVSHEIRTPLAAINGFASCALDHHDLPKDVGSDLGIILRNGKFLVSMVNDLLDFSKSETDPLYIQKSRMHPVREIDDALLMIQPSMAHKGLELKIQFDSMIPENVVSDPTRFRQILINLLSNAVKYTDIGEISVRVSSEQKSEGGVMRVQVGDSGVGMCAKTQQNLFKPFVRGEPADVKRVPGSGLGLALSQSLARRLGGDVRLLSSAPGVGSVFEMTIETGPLSETQFFNGEFLRALPTDLLKRGVERRTLTGKKLLLVEDDPDLRWLMERILKREGATLEMAENGAEAVAQALRDPYHCILMDIKMPVMDGYRATSLLRARGYRNSIVALTASAGSVDKELCFQAGCDAYLSKPVDAAHLLDVLGKQLGGA